MAAGDLPRLCISKSSMCQVGYIPGGATQNTIRIAQTLLRESSPNSCAFIGCVGRDDYADQMTKACADAGFTPFYLQVGLDHIMGCGGKLDECGGGALDDAETAVWIRSCM